MESSAYVVFDFGGVLFDWDPRHLYRKLLPPERMEQFLATVVPRQWNGQMDDGRPFADGIRERVQLFPEHEPLIRAYFDRWPEMLNGVIDGSVRILEELDERGIPLYGLTNWSAETFHHAERLGPFLRRFEDIVVSGREGVSKPSPAIYRRLLERNRLDPTTGIFIDDSKPNVEAAEALGMAGIHFIDSKHLRRALELRGLFADSS